MFKSRNRRSLNRSMKSNSRAWPRLRFETLEDRAVPATINWDGGPTGMGTNWLDAANWVGDVLPGAVDDAVVVAATAGQPTTLTLGGSAAVRSASVDRALQCTSGTLTIGAAVSSFGSFWGDLGLILDGGTMIPLDGASINDSDIRGTGSFTNPVGVTLTLTDTTIRSGFVNNGRLLAQTSTAIVGPPWANNGTIEVNATAGTGGDCIFGDMTNANGASVFVTGTSREVELYGRLTNHGLFQIGPGGAFWRVDRNCVSTGTFNLAGGDLTLYPFIQGGQLVIDGTLTVGAGRTLTADHVPVDVNGALTLESGATFTSNASFTNDGAIAGSGILNTNVSGVGSYRPGSPIGTLTLNGNLTGSGSGPLAVDLNGLNAGSQYDQFEVNGTVFLGRPLSVTLGFVPTAGDTFRIVDNDGTEALTGTFNGLAEAATLTVGGQDFRISYQGGTGNDVTLTTLANAPHAQIAVGDGTAQRSRITQLLVVFDKIVSFAGDPNAAFRLNKIVAGAPAGTVAISVAAATVGSHTEATVTFASDTTFGSLNDGRYRLTVLANQVLFNDTPMAADSVTNFHRFYGDVNGDGRIDIADFGFFSSSFKSQTGDARFLAYLDYNGDGRIDTTDFGQFSARYFTALP